MSVLYTVRSRFTDPGREAAWNEWYAGHLDVLLSVPGFLAAQRFHSPATVDDRPYLAMYEVASPDVFTSEPYLAIWGFDEWRRLIDNWTRDIFERGDGTEIDFATSRDARLSAAFVHGEDEAVRQALAALAAQRPRTQTAVVAGLDRSCGGIAWEILDDAAATGEPPALAAVRIAQAIYAPITDCLGRR